MRVSDPSDSWPGLCYSKGYMKESLNRARRVVSKKLAQILIPSKTEVQMKAPELEFIKICHHQLSPAAVCWILLNGRQFRPGTKQTRLPCGYWVGERAPGVNLQHFRYIHEGNSFGKGHVMVLDSYPPQVSRIPGLVSGSEAVVSRLQERGALSGRP